jgi:hypothetical protein
MKGKIKLGSSSGAGSKSFRGPCEVLVRRSRVDPSEILPRRSLHEDLEDALHLRCLYDSSSWMLL